MPFLKKRGKNPTAKRPRFATQRRQVVSFLQRQKAELSSGDCNFLIDANGDFVLDANGNFICMQDSISRYYTSLNAGLQQYFEIPTVTAAGDFEITGTFFAETSGSPTYLIDGVEGNRLYFFINQNGSTSVASGVTLEIDGTIPPANVRDGLLHTFGLTGSSTNYTVNRIGTRFSSTEAFSGIIANVNFISGFAGVGYTNPRYPLDENFAETTVVRNANAVDGPELVVNGDFSNGTTGWTSSSGGVLEVEDGRLKLTGVYGSYSKAKQTISVTAGVQYLVGGDVELVSGTHSWIIVDDGTTITNLPFGKEEVVTFTSSSVDITLQNHNTGSPPITYYDNISIKESPGAGTAVNAPVSELYTEQSNGDWLGEELVVNGGFDTDSDWTKGEGWAIAAGVASCDGTQTGSSNLAQGSILTVGSLVSITATVSNYTAGQVSLSAGAVPRFHITANGDYQFTQVVNSQTTFYLIADVDFIGSVDIVSVKQLLEVAP